MAYNDIKWEENKAFWSKKIKSSLEQLGLGYLQMKAHYGDIGIINIIRQRLKDIELQRSSLLDYLENEYRIERSRMSPNTEYSSY